MALLKLAAEMSRFLFLASVFHQNLKVCLILVDYQLPILTCTLSFSSEASFQPSSSCGLLFPSLSQMSSDDVGARAKKFEKIFEDYNNGNLTGVTTPIQLARRYREEGATVAESQDYIKQAQIQFTSLPKDPEREKSPSGPQGSGEQSSGGTGGEPGAEESRKRDEEARKAFEEAQWATYLRSVDEAGTGAPSTADINAFLSTVLPKGSLFSLPPGLTGDQVDFDRLVNADPHVARTIAITRRFIQDKSELDLMLLKARSFQLVDPLSHSVWKEVILDRYVNFDKLNYTLQPGYNQADEPKLELGDLVISDKSRISSKKPITSVSDWSRVFGAWAQAVSIIYPHRLPELRAYHFLMSTFFRNHSGNPLVGIRLDDRIREAYSRCPFRLDDRGKFSEHTIAQLSASSDIGKRKDAPSGLASLPKRPAGPICLNWNGNRCKDPCPANRRHGGPSTVDSNSAELEMIRSRVSQALRPRRLDVPLHGSSSVPANTTLNSIPLPRHRRGFGWKNHDAVPISPAVLDSESAPPLPDPPAHLFTDPVVQAALTKYGSSHCKVDTPFNVEAFINLLHDHPNRPLVESVERGFRSGFWPLDDGDWKPDDNRFSDN
ncbi:hypothetical protein PQX77_018943 [Marasmius sp. AFHP31]|nr:hypothetical protein PQX77_018943 [Marasmius sp. AFHP31]